jgi:chromosomal replication initiation ATPase DnaA
MTPSTAYVLPGIEEVLENQAGNNPTPEEFVNQLGLNKPVLVPKQKFQKMWPIFQAVCDLYNEDAVSVYRKNKVRDRKFVEIRQLTMTLFRDKLAKKNYDRLYPLRVIGEFFYKDHATVLFSYKTISNLRETDRKFREETDCLFAGLRWPYLKN